MMTIFYCSILKAINGYKAMLKKNIGATACAAKVRQLGIKRMSLKNANEIELYRIGLKILNELEKHKIDVKREQSANFYYGEEEFLQHLKKLLTEHIIDGDRIVNTAHKSSSALVTAIQLISMAKDKLSDETAQKIYNCSRIITKFGNLEQKQMFNNIIKRNQPRHMSFFFRQLQSFVSYLDEMESKA
ncbi:MAG: hypothetical protein ACD_21C00269G0001 [uncultured bacterium]|nr:MAG: hypothetical protein ACD_21C00269G0001 [uncultured bacterium]